MSIERRDSYQGVDKGLIWVCVKAAGIMSSELSRRCVTFACLAMLLLLAAGCGKSSQVTHVTGTLRFKGEPVAHVIVHFAPAEGRPSWGLTNDKGEFTLGFDRQTPGAATGKNQVYLEYRQYSPKAPTTPPPEVVPLLEKYARDKSPLTVEVDKDGQNIPIDLN